jgi:hypothetical protein
MAVLSRTKTWIANEILSASDLNAEFDALITWINTAKLKDNDGDTQIQLEESSDEDIIRLDIAGTEYIVWGDGTNEEAMKLTNPGTNHGISIQQTGVLASDKHGLYVYTNAVQANSHLVYVHSDNPSSDKLVCNFQNDGTGHGTQVYQKGTLASGKYAMYVYSDAAQTNSALAYFLQDHASSDQYALSVKNDGTGAAVYVNQTGDALAISALTDNASAYTAKFHNDGNNANRYGIDIHAGADDASGTTYYLNAADGNGDQVGYIENNSGTFRLVDGSDERLKENIEDTKVDGLDTINAIPIRDFKWKKSKSKVNAGIVADELLPIFPEAVAGRPGEKEKYEKERAKGNIVDEDGNIIESDVDIRDYRRNKKDLGEFIETTKPVTGERDRMMGVSRERLVPVLIKAIQELLVRVETLESA